MLTIETVIKDIQQRNSHFLTTGSWLYKRYGEAIYMKDSIKLRYFIREVNAMLYPTRTMSNKEIYQASFNRERSGRISLDESLSQLQRDRFTIQIEALETILNTATIEAQIDVLMKMCYRIDMLENDC